jgi:histone deacetylase 11
MEVMGKCYLIKLCYTLPVCYYIQLPLIFLPAFILRKTVLDPMLYATEGTLMALRIASQMKWAINLSGGYHHASFNRGGGFCIYPDISLAVHYLKTRMNIQRIMIIDCDAHQGNGYERDCIGDEGVYIVDLYNHRIYPRDTKAKKAIAKDISIGPYTTD